MLDPGEGDLRTFKNFEPYENNVDQKFYLRTFAPFEIAKVRKYNIDTTKT